MSNIEGVPEELSVGRGDPAYMAHAYLTKVPVPAIIPFLERYTEPGQLVVDPFAGSGMTGVAAAICGRRGRMFDISVLGRHIGRNMVNLVAADELRKAANDVLGVAKRNFGPRYEVACAACDATASLSKSVWSTVVTCTGCSAEVTYYRALESADWSKPAMACPRCEAHVSAKNPRVGEVPVVDCISCECSRNQVEQAPSPEGDEHQEASGFPNVEIAEDRQMYHASALGKNGHTTVASFYSARNRAALVALSSAIREIQEETVRDKLLFCFTACLTRASKRYQWSRQRPLNAANANYYVAPVFYEWNVFELFARKVEAAIRSDAWIDQRRRESGMTDEPLDVSYQLGSAHKIELADDSVDYVFTDPPFGSNLFYADMALFQEAWLGKFTDHSEEAVVDRSRGSERSAERYEELLVGALSECRRILKPTGRVSMVFGNSSGQMWALIQRAIRRAGLEIEPENLVILNKGQRSVKGLASGFEHVATLDLILTMRPRPDEKTLDELVDVPKTELIDLTDKIAISSKDRSPSHLYLEILRKGIENSWRLDDIDLRDVTSSLTDSGWDVDAKSGTLSKPSAAGQTSSKS